MPMQIIGASKNSEGPKTRKHQHQRWIMDKCSMATQKKIETLLLATQVQTSYQILSTESLENYLIAKLYRI